METIHDRLSGTKIDYSKAKQTRVSFVGGSLAGDLCVVVSQAADVIPSQS